VHRPHPTHPKKKGAEEAIPPRPVVTFGEIWDSENTLVGTNIYIPSQGTFEDDCPLPKVGYVISSEGTFELNIYHPVSKIRNSPNTFLYPRDPIFFGGMVVEPKYFAEEVIVHPNHPLTR